MDSRVKTLFTLFSAILTHTTYQNDPQSISQQNVATYMRKRAMIVKLYLTTVEPLIKDTRNKRHLSIKDTCFDPMLIVSRII